MDVRSVHFESAQEKEWYYRWFEPDVVVGIGYWGHTPHLVLHPQRYGVQPVPWLVADGYMANYQEVLNALPLILVTSNWVKEIYVRDGIDGRQHRGAAGGLRHRRVRARAIRAIRRSGRSARRWAWPPDQIMILTVGGDAASKGAQEVMQALAMIDTKAPDWKYVCKVWPQPRTETAEPGRSAAGHASGHRKERRLHHQRDLAQFHALPDGGLRHLRRPVAAGGIRHAPGGGQRLRQAGDRHQAMGMLDTLVHGETAFWPAWPGDSDQGDDAGRRSGI